MCQQMVESPWLGFQPVRLTGKVSLFLVGAVVFPSGCVVPFHSNPVSRGTDNLADIPYSAYRTIIGQPVAYLCLRCHAECRTQTLFSVHCG